MSIPFESLTDRQKRLIEARVLFNEDVELRNRPLEWIARDRRGYGLRKDRWAIAMGLLGRESSWDLAALRIADFGNVNAAGSVTNRTGFGTLPLTNPAHLVGSIDPEPYEVSTLAAASGDRQIGSSSAPVAILLGTYLTHITSAAAVYNSAAASVNVRVVSTVTTVGGAFTTLSTLAWTAGNAPNFVDTVPITATTGRTISLTGSTVAGIAGLFNGDTLFAELATGGALNVIGNILYVTAEVA